MLEINNCNIFPYYRCCFLEVLSRVLSVICNRVTAGFASMFEYFFVVFGGEKRRDVNFSFEAKAMRLA